MAQDKTPLIWIDMEMSGLVPERERILEVAMVVTDAELNVLGEAPVLVIHQPDAVLDGMDKLGHVFFGVVNVIMRFAPIGAFGAMAFTVGKFGLGTLASLGWLLLSVYLTCALFVFVVLAAA